MTLFFKHNYFRYLILLILSLKVSCFIIETITTSNTTEICCEIDFEDTENDEKSELDEESKEINQTVRTNAVASNATDTWNYFTLSNLYRIQYLEFITPPPETV